MTKEEIFAAIDAAISAKWASIKAQQEAFRSVSGHYWQGLLTHSEVPSDGEATAPDRATAAPSDQPVSWANMEGLPSEMMAALRCDTYEGPGGPGYVLTAVVQIEGTLYERSINVGPESGREADWHERPIM